MISRRILAAALLLCAPQAHAQTGSIKTPAQLNGEINALFPNNFIGAITPFQARQIALDQIASVPFFAISAKNVGAACDGTTDDTSKIQAAFNTGRTVILPDSATCLIAGTLTISVAGTGLIGAGWQSSVLTSSSTTGVMINVNAGVNNVTLSGFKLTRSVTATSNADGIFFGGNTEQTTISNIWVENQFHGLSLATTSYSTITNIVSQTNQANGILMVDTATNGTLQWYINGALMQKNAGRGLLVQTGNGTLQSTLGSWSGIVTFGNTLNGIAVAGTASAPIFDLRLSNSFLGQDGQSEFFLDTHGGNHLISDTFIELCGTGSTGPTLSTVASGVGHGAQVSANNRDVRFVNVTTDANSQDGFSLAATQKNTLSGSRASNNGAFGLALADGTTGIINGFDASVGNTSGPFLITSNGNSVVASGNSPPINPSITASLGSDVLLNNSSNYFDGPSITLGAGTWSVSGTVSLLDTAGAAGMFCKLWNGTAVIASGNATAAAANFSQTISLSGAYVATNGDVVKISCRDTSATTGKILFNNTGNSKDSTITAIRAG